MSARYPFTSMLLRFYDEASGSKSKDYLAIRQAAELKGQNMSDFVRTTAARAAARLINQEPSHESHTLGRKARTARARKKRSRKAAAGEGK